MQDMTEAKALEMESVDLLFRNRLREGLKPARHAHKS